MAICHLILPSSSEVSAKSLHAGNRKRVQESPMTPGRMFVSHPAVKSDSGAIL
jgi:hypothetical protein